MAIENFRAPALPLPGQEYDRVYFDQLLNALRLYFNQLDATNANQAFSYRADKFILNTNAAAVSQYGTISWNSADETLNIGMANGVTQQVGEEIYARVANTTGVLIPNGSVVGFVGATAEALLVAPYLADGSSPSLYILGVMTHDLPDSGQKGYCTTWGFVRDLDTSAFSVGDVLYASPTVAGGFTNVKPTAPNNVIPLASCLISHPTTGVIFVRPTITQMQYYGEFAATVDQTVPVVNTAYAVTFDTTQISNGVIIGTPATRLVVPQSGLYRVLANIQVSSSSAAPKSIWTWFRKNGVDIPNSARLSTSDINNGYIAVSHDATISMSANDYVEIMYAADSTNVLLSATPATAFSPATTSAQVTITQAQQ